MKLIKCARKLVRKAELSIIIALAGMQIFPSGVAYAQTKEHELSMDVSLKEAVTLSPGTQYSKTSLNDILDVDVNVDGKKDAIASVSYYCLPTEKFLALSDKSENAVKQQDGFTTSEDLIDGCAVESVTFVVYHTFEGADIESGQETKMATDEVMFVVTQSALDVVETYKTGKWYETSENGVNWKFTINDDGKIDKLYTESTCLDDYIVSGTLMVPASINGIPVVGIGSGTTTPFIPQSVDSYTEIDFPITLQVIGDYAFYKNSVYADVNFSRTLLEIGKKAFYSSKLKSVTIAGDTTVNELAFGNSRYLENVNLCGNINVKKRAFDGGMFGSSLASLVMTDKVSLEEMAFCNNQALTDLTVTKGTVMDETSFYNCENIKNVILTGDADIPDETFGEAKISYSK